MWSKISNSKAAYMVLAIVCSIALWLYVDIVEAPKSTTTVSNIPVTFVGEDALEQEGLMIVDGSEITVSLKLEGPRSAISQVNRSNIKVTVQAASQITGEGHYTLYYDTSLPSAVSNNLTIIERSTTTIDVDVVKMTTKSVPIEGRFTGSVVEGARVSDTDFEFEQKTVKVSGESTQVDKIDHAQVVLDAENLSATWSGDLPIKLVDAEGNEVDKTGLNCDINTVYTIFPVQIVKEVPLTVDYTTGGGATEENATTMIEPEKVTISGTPDQLKQIDSIDLGPIDLSKIVTSEVLHMDIPLPEGVSVISGSSTAKVTVSMSGLTTRMVTTSDIELINAPSGTNVSLITQSLDVRIRGAAATMDLVQDGDVYVIVDLAELGDTTQGSRTMLAKVGVRGFADVGAVGDYQVVVSIGGS